MAKSFKVMIVTPDKTAYEGDVVSATIPGLAGYLGIWANHAPLVAAVVPGVVTLRIDDAGSEQRLAVGGGFVEVSDTFARIARERGFFVTGFGFRGGALASTIGHDAHNLAAFDAANRKGILEFGVPYGIRSVIHSTSLPRSTSCK